MCDVRDTVCLCSRIYLSLTLSVCLLECVPRVSCSHSKRLLYPNVFKSFSLLRKRTQIFHGKYGSGVLPGSWRTSDRLLNRTDRDVAENEHNCIKTTAQSEQPKPQGRIHTGHAAVTPENRTCCCQWEYSHYQQATSKEKRSNLRARRVPLPV